MAATKETRVLAGMVRDLVRGVERVLGEEEREEWVGRWGGGYRVDAVALTLPPQLSLSNEEILDILDFLRLRSLVPMRDEYEWYGDTLAREMAPWWATRFWIEDFWKRGWRFVGRWMGVEEVAPFWDDGSICFVSLDIIPIIPCFQ